MVTKTGDYVIIELKRSSSDVTVGQICRYFGWVQEHLALPHGKQVFGLILAQEVSDQLRYAVKATNDRIRYMALALEVSLGAAQR